MGTIENKGRPGRPDESVKSPEVAALLRNQLAPDSPASVKYPGTPTVGSYEGAKGNAPSGRQSLPGFAPTNDPRTAPQGGDPGPM